MSSLRSRSGGNEERHHVEAVEEVVAKLAAGDGILQDLVGGGDDANVHLNGARPAETHEVPFFEHAEELGLHAERHVADFVEEERARAGFFEQTFFAAARVGESARLIAEEFALE